jgi:RimJ/RimL family protein N-acetyltransferase
VWRGPAYLVPPGAGAGATLDGSASAVSIEGQNAALLGDAFGPWAAWLEHRRPCLAVVERDRALAICFSSRIGAGACEAGVETVPAHRGRGLAGVAVAAWAAAVRRGGRLPLYSTAWDNAPSRRVAEKLGARLLGEDWHVGCGPG